MRYILILLAFSLISGTVIYQAVRHDSTLTGEGITGSELKVDTTIIATVTKSNGGRSTYATVSTISSDQDNYSPTGWATATHVRLDADNGIRAITSFAAPTATTDAYEKTLINGGSYPIYIPMDHPDGTAANRVTGSGSDYILFPGEACKLWYDMVSSRWRIIGHCEIKRGKTVLYEYNAASITAGDFGQVGFSVAGSSGTITATNATSTHPVHALLSTAASSTGAYVVYMPKSSTLFSYFGTAHISTETLVSIPTLSDGTNTYTFELKLSATPAGGSLEENNMYGIRYSHGINSGKWELFSQNNTGTEAVADLGVTVTADVLYKLRIEIDKTHSEVRAYVNGSYAGRVTSSLANGTAISASVMLLKSVGATARTVRLHNLSCSAIYP